MLLLILLQSLGIVYGSSGSQDSLIYAHSDTYKLIFEDDFEGAELDTAKWITYIPHIYLDSLTGQWGYDDHEEFSRLFHRYDEPEPKFNGVFVDQNVQVSDGRCKIYTRKEETQWMGYKRGYSTGVLHSTETLFGDGVYILRARMGAAYLFTYAFWLFGVVMEEGVNVSSEVDFFEFFNRRPRVFESNLHKWKNFEHVADKHGESRLTDMGWHTYMGVIDDIAVSIYVDDRETPVFVFYKNKDSATDQNITYQNQHQIPRQRWQSHDYAPDSKQRSSVIIGAGTTRNKAMKRQNKWTHRRSPAIDSLEIDYIKYYRQWPLSTP